MSEQRIREESPELYEAIKELVSFLPDFRPEETMKRMKQEPQNNWKLVETELQALSSREEDSLLMAAIYEGDLNIVKRFLDRKEFLEEFFLTYRALLWLAARAAPEATILTLIVSTRNLSVLPHPIDYSHLIPWISDIETAKYIYYSDPNAIRAKDDLFIEWAKEGKLGYVLWTLSSLGSSGSGSITILAEEKAIMAAAKEGHLYIVKALLDSPRSTGARSRIALVGAMDGNKPHIVEFLLNKKLISKALASEALIDASNKGMTEIVQLLLNYGADPTIKASLSLYRAVEMNHLEILKLLIANELVEKRELGPILFAAINKNRRKMVRAILESGKLSKEYIEEHREFAKRTGDQRMLGFLQ